MNKKVKIFIAVAIMTIIAILYKVQLVMKEPYYLAETWIEDIIIFAGLAMLFGGFIDFLCKKKGINYFKTVIIDFSVILIGAASYYTQVAFTYIAHVNKVDEKEMQIFIESIKTARSPWMMMLITVAVFIITLLFLQRYPRLINRDVKEDLEINITIDEEKAQFKNYDFNNQVVKNMVCLRNYDYNDNHKGLNFLDTTESNEIFNSTTDKFYMAEYDGKMIGYFVVRENTNNYEVIDFYASYRINESFQVLYYAMKKYFDSIKKANVCVKNVGLLDKNTGFNIEMIIKCYTDANYQLIGANEDGGKTNYDICFEV